MKRGPPLFGFAGRGLRLRVTWRGISVSFHEISLKASIQEHQELRHKSHSIKLMQEEDESRTAILQTLQNADAVRCRGQSAARDHGAGVGRAAERRRI